MIVKLSPTQYLDISHIVYIEGKYTSENPDDWETIVSFGPASAGFKGMVGKEIMNAFEWKARGHTIDMTTGSPTYKKTI